MSHAWRKRAAATPVATPPEWDILRDFESGIPGANATGVDAFSGSSGLSVYTTEQAAAGSQSVKMTTLQGSEAAFDFGGIVNFTTPAYQTDTVWIRLKTFLPETFSIVTPGNGSLKYLRIRKRTAAQTHVGYFDFQMRDDTYSNTRYRMIQEGVAANWVNLGPNSPVPRGVWVDHTLCLFLHATVGVARVRFWENATLLVDTTTLPTLVNATDEAYAFYLYTYWNGGAPQTQSCYADDIRIAKNGTPTWATDLEGVV